MRTLAIVLLLGVLALSQAKVYFKETFDGDWESRWVVSDWKKSAGEAGKWVVSAGQFHADAEKNKGLQTSQDARFYAISSAIKPEFSNVDKTLVIQFSVKHEQKIDCGGGYIKVFPKSLDQAKLSGDSDYNIMFGPDICGTSTKKIHVIFNYKNKNHLIKKEIPCEDDQLTHVYTLIVKPDNSYEVRVDGDKKESGKLEEDWEFLPEKMIKDPSQKKPSDWVDEAMIDDPTDKKPENYDDTPKQIPDPEADKPDDWDDETDGAWEAPTVENPEWKGEWKAKRIANPAYKGKWVHPEIANPDYKADATIYSYASNAFVGLDLWQVKAGTIFDNVIITDSVTEAEEFMADTYGSLKSKEKAAFSAFEDKKKEQDAEASKKAEASKADDDDEDSDDEDSDDEDHKGHGHEEL